MGKMHMFNQDVGTLEEVLMVKGNGLIPWEEGIQTTS
jgi:hypothetical protein